MRGTGAMIGIVFSNIVMLGVGMGDQMLSIGIISGSIIQWAIPLIVHNSLNSGDE